MNFAPIHNHTEYSSLDGVSKVSEIVERCKCIGCTAAGITDHKTVAGHLEFAKVMTANGLKPIFGCEFYHGMKTTFKPNERDASHFVGGALTDEGLRNIWRMVDSASTNFRFVDRLNWEMMEKYSEGVFATSACIQGTIPRGIHGTHEWDPYEVLNKYLSIYGENFYIEIHTYPGIEHENLNRELVSIANERGIPLIYATDAHFAGPDQYEFHDAYVAMQTGDTILMDPEDRKMWHPKSLYIQDEEQIRASLAYLPESAVDEALRNSGELADRCNAQLPEVRRHLPAFIPKECPWLDKNDRRSAPELFIDLVEEGLVHRYGEDAPDEVWDRAEYEMDVFINANVGLPGGLSHYFLQAWDFCQFCDSEGIHRGPGRGSSAGAIVAYALGLTDIDPLKYGLIFERFYNPGREKGFPDIDNDFPVKDRTRVRQYLMDRWGSDRVRTIGTITRLKPLAAIEKTYKVCGVSWEEMDAVKKIVHTTPDIDILDSEAVGWDNHYEPGKDVYVMAHCKDKIAEYISQQSRERAMILRDWLAFVEFICSRISGFGVHPSGVVVSDIPLNDELPCIWNNNQKVQVTCFPMADVDTRQFVKQDLLGLRSLDTLDEWERIVGKVDWSGMEGQDWPEEMWKLLEDGYTLGIFQIEDGYGRTLCKKIKPRNVNDLAVIIGLNRPGPLRSGAPESLMARRNGAIDDKFDGRKIPILEGLLDPTFGWFLYQEQVIFYFERLGYSKSDADAVRKILGKKKPVEMAKLKNGEGEWEGKGYAAMAVKAGLDPETAQTIWEKLEDFAKYSFNKSHMLAYATVVFRKTYAKWKDLRAFYIAAIRTLSNSKDNKKAQKIGALISEARRAGIKVLPPDILRSEPEIAIVDGDILFGLANVKGVKSSARHICALRKTYDLSTPESLLKAIEIENTYWEERRDAAKAEGLPFRERSMKGLIPRNRVEALFDAGAWDPYLDRQVTMAKQQKTEAELLGVILTDDNDHIFAENDEIIQECDDYAMTEYAEDGSRLWLPGVISTIKPKLTKKDRKPMGIIVIEYQGDELEFVVFPKAWADHKSLWRERTPAIWTLKKSDRGLAFDRAIRLR